MTRLQRRTPCIGICSTTYGDLVCRGCKRFAHEIVEWNQYSDAQRSDVVARLNRLKSAVVATQIAIVDRDRCIAALGERWQEGKDLLLVAYDYLTEARAKAQPLTTLLPVRLPPGVNSAAALRKRVDAEILARSKAIYERNFKVPVD